MSSQNAVYMLLQKFWEFRWIIRTTKSQRSVHEFIINMRAGKIKAAVFVAVMMSLIEESGAAMAHRERLNQRTLGIVKSISGGQKRNLLSNDKRNFKSSFKALLNKKPFTRKRRMRRSKKNHHRRAIEENYNQSRLTNAPSQLVQKFAGRVPTSVVTEFDRDMRLNAPSSGSNQSKFKGRQSKISKRSNNLPPVTFGEFNYNHLIKRPSSCAKNANIDTSSDVDYVDQTVAVSSSTPPPPPDPNIPLMARHKEAIISEHNEYRSSIEPQAADMRLISWDDELQWISQTFTNSCYVRDLLETNTFHPNGSQANLKPQLRRHSYYATEIGHAWFSWPETYDIPSDFASTAFQAWASEKRFFNRATMECDALCEHYLQLVWAETFKVGCSVAWCSNPNINGVTWPQTLLLVCSYTPRGALPNFMAAYPQYRTSNRKNFIEPYTKGSSCSLCVFDPNDPNQDIEEMRSVTDTCSNNLCANDFRDQIIPFVAPKTTTQFSWFRPTTKSTTTNKSPSYQTTDGSVDIDVQNKDNEDEILVTGLGRKITPTTSIVLLLFLASFYQIT